MRSAVTFPGSNSMSHKIDLGFYHHNLSVTSPRHYRDNSLNARSGSGLLLSPQADEVLTCTIRGGRGPNSLVTVRCRPVEDDGLLDLSGTEVTDTIIGDVDSEPREQALARERNGEPAAALGQQQPQQGGGHHTSDASLAHALRAHIPKGPLAEDAAMCEPMPGDAPGRITDDELAAMRAGGAGASRYAAAKTSGTANTGSSGGVEGRGAEREGGTTATTSSSAAAEGVERGEGGSNAPADSPEHIKQVVDEETLRDAKYNEF